MAPGVPHWRPTAVPWVYRKRMALPYVHRLIHVTHLKFLGAEFSWNVAVPLVYRSVRINSFNIDDSNFGVGQCESGTPGTGMARSTVGFPRRLRPFAPTGDRDNQHPAKPGKDFWTHYPYLRRRHLVL